MRFVVIQSMFPLNIAPNGIAQKLQFFLLRTICDEKCELTNEYSNKIIYSKTRTISIRQVNENIIQSNKQNNILMPYPIFYIPNTVLLLPIIAVKIVWPPWKTSIKLALLVLQKQIASWCSLQVFNAEQFNHFENVQTTIYRKRYKNKYKHMLIEPTVVHATIGKTLENWEMRKIPNSCVSKTIIHIEHLPFHSKYGHEMKIFTTNAFTLEGYKT